MGNKRVDFGRINRHAQAQLGQRPFRDDIMRLIEVGYLESGFDGSTWLATDLSTTASSDFAVGVLAYEVEQRRRHLDGDEDLPSWVKTDPTADVGATPATTVPFAIDLDASRRWIAYAPSQRIHANRFREYFGKMLDEAAERAALLPADWEIVPLQSRPRVFEWLSVHPDVSLLIRVVKMPNPGVESQLTEDLRKMSEMAVREKEEKYKPRHGATINLRNPELLDELFEGLEDGDIDVQLHARSGDMISSRDAAEHKLVPDWGDDLALGIDRVLRALVEYVFERTHEGSPDEH